MTSGLSPTDFGAFFQAVHGTVPFPWQHRLLDHVVSTGTWPDVIDLPTGSGKTAALDVALFSLALDPDRFPRRTAFVIDRRIVVDQVVNRALRLADRLAAALASPDGGVVREVASRLASLSDSGRPLGVVGLRGGVRLDTEWARRPDEPWIIATTVDQFGSRLLFRGYGTSERMRPVHAALAGSDCLVLLDEVQISRAFADTLAAVSTAARRSGPSPLPSRWAVVEMSATPGNRQGQRFSIAEEDTDPSITPELARRLRARKLGKLKLVGRPREDPASVLPSAIRSELGTLPPSASVVGVVVNRVRTARSIMPAAEEAGWQAHLLTGRMRPLDRVDALADIGALVDPENRDARPDGRHLIVGTQSIEVGADFSFDALVTEAAPIDALRQRFGRLDRRGTFEALSGSPAQAIILGPRAAVESPAPDPVYGNAVKETWTALQGRFGDEVFDVGPLAESLADMPEDAIASSGRAPVMPVTHLDAWVQTLPPPDAEPRVEPFLHGLGSTSQPEVSIVWRADLTPDDLDPSLPEDVFMDGTAALLVCPPRSSEMLSVPIWAARAWLAEESSEIDVADVDRVETMTETGGRGGARALRARTSPSRRVGLRWRGPAELDRGSVVRSQDLRPGDVLVVPAAYGGIADRNWDPASSRAVTDLGDRAQWEFGHRVVLRLQREVLADYGLPAPPPVQSEDTSTDDRERISQWLGEALTAPPYDRWLAEAMTRLRSARYRIDVAGSEPDRYFVISCPAARATAVPMRTAPGEPLAVDPDILDGSDETNSFTDRGITLKAHLEGVGERAHLMASRLGFPPEVASDLELAGRLHDLGKLDDRFQLRLHGGDEVSLAMSSEPLAKSLPGVGTRPPRCGYPEGMRHEILSLALVQAAPELLLRAHDPDLVLHLIASHHGYCRPLPPLVDDPAPRAVSARVDGFAAEASTALAGTRIAAEVADRFWALVGRYGHHGLAWIEAVLRLADHRQSEEETSR